MGARGWGLGARAVLDFGLALPSPVQERGPVTRAGKNSKGMSAGRRQQEEQETDS
jgi:hypothetical protein